MHACMYVGLSVCLYVCFAGQLTELLVRVSQWNFCIIFQAVVTSNLRARNNMSFEVYYNAVKQSRYTGNDLTVIMLSRMLKVVILVIHPTHIWLSNYDVNVRDANVVLSIDEKEVFTATGQFLFMYIVVVVTVNVCV